MRKILLACCLTLSLTAFAGGARAQESSIATVVNGDIITRDDVDNAGRLFGLTTGVPITPDMLQRLRPQVTRQLVDEKLRLQEIQRRHIVVTDQEIAEAIGDIERRNNLPSGGLRMKLGERGVAYRSLVDQIRVQIGWIRILHQEFKSSDKISDGDVDAQAKLMATHTGQTEYRISEIFLPADNMAGIADAKRFASVVIDQLRAGAAFPVVAAQFSQSQNALQGGDEGWKTADQIDPAEEQIAAQMPEGAISNPIMVPGGIAIISLHGKRQIGRQMATILSLRQLFLPFTEPLNPSAPTAQQKHQLDSAKQLQKMIHDCAGMEDEAKILKSSRPVNPGDVVAEQLTPPSFRAMVMGMQPNEISKPLVAPDGIGLVMLCSRETKNVAEQSKSDLRAHILNDRVELLSRQLLRDLRRRAVIDQRDH